MRRAALAAVLVLAGSGCGAGGEPEPEAATARPNILLVTLCTFRYSHMGAAGYDRDTTPFLDALAAQGIFFENAISASSWTKPATASILTGLTPNVHGMTDFYKTSDVVSGRVTPARVLADEIVTLAETLRAEGYATAARSNNVHVSEHFNMLQGFDDAVAGKHMDAARMVAELDRFLAGLDPEVPFFFFLLSRDPHVTYDPRYEYYRRFNRVEPPVSRQRYVQYYRSVRDQAVRAIADPDGAIDPELRTRYVDLYDAELAQQDAALSRLPAVLERAGRARDTYVLVTADHGENLFDHGLLGHGARLGDTTLRVPLVIAGPGLPQGRRVSRVVRSIDLYPTIAARAGARAPELLQGRDLLGDDGDPEGHAATAFASVYENEHMVRRDGHGFYLRKEGAAELFDLDADPGELRDLAAERPALATALGASLRWWFEREAALAARVARGPAVELAPQAIEQLRALGYLDPGR